MHDRNVEGPLCTLHVTALKSYRNQLLLLLLRLFLWNSELGGMVPWYVPHLHHLPTPTRLAVRVQLHLYAFPEIQFPITPYVDCCSVLNTVLCRATPTQKGM